MNQVALGLSLTYGCGDTRWFDKLPRLEQARVYAYATKDQKPPPKPRKGKGERIRAAFDAQRKGGA